MSKGDKTKWRVRTRWVHMNGHLQNDSRHQIHLRLQPVYIYTFSNHLLKLELDVLVTRHSITSILWHTRCTVTINSTSFIWPNWHWYKSIVKRVRVSDVYVSISIITVYTSTPEVVLFYVPYTRHLIISY